ncbi:RNA polymerase sigma factor [Alicyclobacillus shizuokensis]|uniref:RNA polymerase sigma factor n=1 Tax=Alicyclobacillus shizuokensis TaxID=392014 RepID=UPI003570F1ED
MSTSRHNGTPLELEQREAIECWVEQYYSKLFAVALAILNDYHLAQDCVQESLIKAVMNINKLHDPDKALAWLCTIVRNECRTVLRSSWKRKIKLSSQPIESSQIDSSTRKALDIYQTLACLRKEYREILVLYYVNGFLLKEISEIINIRESTCRVRLHRARRALKKLLEKEGY